MRQEPGGGPSGGITVDSTEVSVGDTIEIVVTDGSSTVEIVVAGTLGSQQIPVPSNGVVNMPVPPVASGTQIVISNGTVSGGQVVVTVVPRTAQ